MSYYVFKDDKKTKKLHVKDCTSANKGIEYFCPTPNCPARMTIRSLDGERSRHFAALISKPHDKSICRLNKTSDDEKNLNTDNFNIDSLLDLLVNQTRSITHSTNEYRNYPSSSTETLNTILKLYSYCKNHDLKHKLNDNYKVEDIIADSRNNNIFSKGIWDKRLIETKFKKFNRLNSTITVKYPVDSTLPNQYTLTLKFENSNEFNVILDKLFDTEDFRSAFIIFLGECINNTITIHNHKQIKIIDYK